MNDGLALPLVLFFLALAEPGRRCRRSGRSSWWARWRSER